MDHSRMRTSSYIGIIAVLCLSCSASTTFIERHNRDWEQQPAPEQDDLVYKVLLIGDTGAPKLDGTDPVLNLFESHLERAGENSAAIFLGDNIYMNGLPDSTHPNRKFYEDRINVQLDMLEDYEGRVIFLPGNHDWDDGGPDGLNAVRRQEQYIEAYLDRGNTFLPDDGFPGPHEVKLMDKDDDPRLEKDIRFVALDTQWWLHKGEKPYGDTGDYVLNDAGDVVSELQDIVRDRKNDFVIVGAHHPIVSKDLHGGFVPFKTHLLPPVGGTAYALYRKAIGYEQDIPNRHYQTMTNFLVETFKEKEEVFYVSGHAHGLQYNKFVYANRYTQHYLISGAGSKTSYIADGRGSEFSHEDLGFMTLNIYADGSVWMEAWAPVEGSTEGRLLYRTILQAPYGDVLEEVDNVDELPDYDYSDSTVTIAPNPEYDKVNKFHRFLLGNNHRELWGIEAEFPVFDVTEVEGGLTPTTSGGRGQSNSLHLLDEDGTEYMLRSVDKVAGKVWSEHLKNTYALEVAQDQFSMLDPYAALVVANLAQSVGVYYSQPKLYYIPDDPRLGRYAEEMAGSLALFERKPDDDMSDVASVDYADDIVSHLDMVREMAADIDHRVDQEMFVKFRLFDMVIGDWDRHYDQWRWAATEPEDEQGKIYKPIPRDRDVALMQLDGVGNQAGRILGPLIQYQNTTESYGNFKGLNFNSLGITRLFTNQVTKEEWISISEELKARLTDEAIEKAVSEYPPEVFEVRAEEVVRFLKARRDQLPEKAEQYYDLISTVVSVPGSNKREVFDVQVLSKDSVRVEVYKMSGGGELREKYFDRTFSFDETREVRLYGLGGDDRFEVSGEDRNKIRVRIIGGPGSDVIEEKNPETRRKMLVYDTKNDNTVDVGRGTKTKLSNSAFVNYYDYENEYAWNANLAGFYFNYNHAQGVYLGGGPRIYKNSYKRIPAQFHFLRGNIAPSTLSMNIKYTGFWYNVTKDVDLNVEGTGYLPGSYQYFYGLGNETTEDEREKENYYRTHISQYDITGKAIWRINNVLVLDAGAGYKLTRVKDVTGDNSVLNTPQAGVSPNIYDDQSFLKFVSGIKINGVDNPGNPKHGMYVGANMQSYYGLNSSSENFTQLNLEWRFYITAKTRKQITYAHRFGYDHLFGNFPFFEANTLGGISNLRGYHPRRFSGRSSFHTNSELRLELFDFYEYYLGGRVGMVLFSDTGRVYYDGEDSDKWHSGYGGGLWMDFFDMAILNFMYGRSQDDYSIEFRIGFMF